MNLSLKFDRKVFTVIKKIVSILIRSSKSDLIFTFCGSFISGVLPAALGLVTKLIIDSLVAQQSFRYIVVLLAIELALVITLTVITRLTEVFRMALGEKVERTLRIEFLKHAIDLDLSYYEQPQNHDLLHKAQSEMGYRPTMMTTSFLGIFQSVITIISFIFVIATFQPLLLLILITAMIPAAIAAIWSSNLSVRNREILTPDHRRAAFFDDALISDYTAKEVRLFNLGETFLRKSDEYHLRTMKSQINLEKIQNQGYATVEAFSHIVKYAVIVFVAYQTFAGKTTIGDFTLIIAALSTVNNGLFGILSSLGDLLEGALLFGDLTAFLETQPSIKAPSNPQPICVSNCKSIRLNNVSFGYPNTSKTIFTNLNLEFRQNETTAIVGLNGAGKTTLVKLVTRLYEPDEGQILLDGMDIREFDPIEYRKMFGVIMQDFVHYPLSAKENISLGQDDETINATDLLRAAKQAAIHEFIENLPNQWETFLGRMFDEVGQDLSGGQWQRIALARAIYRNAPILILDEPTSSLDAEAEAEIFEAYRKLVSGKLSILITHRLNTVKDVDRIIVLENGIVLEEGDHNTLLSRRGRYYELFSTQAKHYQLDTPI